MKNYKLIKTQEDFNKMLEKMSLTEIKEEYFNLITYWNKLNASTQVPRIFMTREQFDAIFVIKEPTETVRGRKKTILTDEDKAKQIERRREYQRNRYHKMKEENN